MLKNSVLHSIVIVLLGIVLLQSCLSRHFNREDLWGIVYDGDGQPLQDVRILNKKGKELSVSDIEGRFLLPNLASGEHQFTIEKEGYETIVNDVSFNRKGQILYVRLSNYFQLRNTLEKHIANEQWSNCLDTLVRMDGFANADKNELLFYRAILAFKQNEYTESITYLEEIIKSEHEDEYVYMFLADIYEYHIRDNVQSLEYLYNVVNTVNVAEEMRTIANARILALEK